MSGHESLFVFLLSGVLGGRGCKGEGVVRGGGGGKGVGVVVGKGE